MKFLNWLYTKWGSLQLSWKYRNILCHSLLPPALPVVLLLKGINAIPPTPATASRLSLLEYALSAVISLTLNPFCAVVLTSGATFALSAVEDHV